MKAWMVFFFTDKIEDLYKHLCFVFSETPIGEMLNAFDNNELGDTFLDCYANDFLKASHKCRHVDFESTDNEYQVRS